MQDKARNPLYPSEGRINLYLILLLMIFVTVAGVLAVFSRPQVLHDPLILLLVGLAAYRGGRAVAYNFIFTWLRAPFTLVVDDSSGAGKSVEARGKGLRRVLGELLCCPTCAGTWVGLMLAGLLVVAYPLGLLLAFVLAASGISEILHWWSERNEWQGRAAREEAGSSWLWKHRESVNETALFQYAETGHEKKENSPV